MKKILNFIKENIVFILILIIIGFSFEYKLPYYIEGDGGLININDRYKIDSNYKIKGSFNMTYVSEYDGTIFSLMLAKIKGYDILKREEVVSSNETEEENEFRGLKMLHEATDNAIILAYNKASKKCDILSSKMYVTYIYKDANTNLKIGDIITNVDGIDVNTNEEIKKIIRNKKVGDKLIIKVINDNQIYERYAYILKQNIIGILITYERELNTEPKIEINYKNDEFGPSGGLITSLAIYNKLVKEDITNGKKIAGTGTIDINGNVGEIDGIKHKLKGAVKEHADIFFVPKENYKEAINLKKKKHYKIKIIKVETFDEALNYLKNKEE